MSRPIHPNHCLFAFLILYASSGALSHLDAQPLLKMGTTAAVGDLQVEPDLLVFDSLLVATSSVAQTIELSNTGVDTLTISQIQTPSWITVSQTTATFPPVAHRPRLVSPLRQRRYRFFRALETSSAQRLRGEYSRYVSLPAPVFVPNWNYSTRTTGQSGLRKTANKHLIQLREGPAARSVWRPASRKPSCLQRVWRSASGIPLTV